MTDINFKNHINACDYICNKTMKKYKMLWKHLTDIWMNLRFFPEAMICEMRLERCIEVELVKTGGKK